MPVMHAYDGIYIEDAQDTLGNMMEYAVNTCHMDPETFYSMFLLSGVANQFANGNPRVIVGMSGGELAREVVYKSTGKLLEEEEVYYLEKTREYWAGWILAYYQWETGRSFQRINEYLTLTDILCMYKTHHEADVSKFVETAEKIFKSKHRKTYLSKYRDLLNYSIEELAKEAKVPVDVVQELDSNFESVWNTDCKTLYKMSKILNCRIEDLLEI